MSAPNSATYLGDGLYADLVDDGYQVRLFASNGIRVTNEVFLDAHVLAAFEAWLATRREDVS